MPVAMGEKLSEPDRRAGASGEPDAPALKPGVRVYAGKQKPNDQAAASATLWLKVQPGGA